MSGSRRILLALLLASVTCLFVVQVALDNRGSDTAMTYAGEALLKPERNLLTDQEPKKQTPISNPPTKAAVATTKTAVLTPKNTTSTTIRKQTTMAAPPKQIRLAPPQRRRSPHVAMSRDKQQLLVNRNDRIQEILRRSSAARSKIIAVDPMKTLKTMPVVDPRNVTRILIVTYFRAGSSFFGDLLQQNWKTFYQFEPLHSMTYDSRIGDDKLPEAFRLFAGIFRCNSTDQKDYFQWAIKPRNQFLFAHNVFLWATCRSSMKMCFSPTFVDAVCQRAPVHVMKVTRLHMRQLEQFLEQNPDLNIKVVFLTRDPRGILSSRWKLEWCNNTKCSTPEILCREMNEDIRVFKDLRRKEPSKFVKVRYEDLSLNPEEETRRVFQLLNLPFSQSVRRFLKTHTVGRKTDENPYSTWRNSSAMAFSWRDRFTFKQVEDVQSSCDVVLRSLNHSLITSPNQLTFPYGAPKKNKTAVIIHNKKLKQKLNPRNRNLKSASSLPALARQVKDYPLSGGDVVGNLNLSDDKILAIRLWNSTKTTGLNLNNTKIEIHKVYYVMPSISPKNMSVQTNYFWRKSDPINR